MRPVTATQFKPSAVQMVGRLPGIVTTAPAGATGPLTGTAAFALATLTVVALASSALALAFAAAVVLAAVCRCSLSSFCSSSRSCCRSSAISESLPPADSACACEASISPIKLAAVTTPDFVLDMRASPYHPGFSSPPCAGRRHCPIAARPVVQLEKLRRSRRRWLVESVNDADSNLCPLRDAAIASAVQRKEN